MSILISLNFIVIGKGADLSNSVTPIGGFLNVWFFKWFEIQVSRATG